MIPNVIHFIFGLKEDFGQQPFSLVHYLAIKSAYECNRPDIIKFYYKYEPRGEWWEKSKQYLTLIKVDPPTEIFGKPLLHFAHQADVLRLEILMREGGIYLDMDILSLNSLAPLRKKYKCVMGMEEGVGLCNAVILAERNAEFLKICYEEYRTFRSKGFDEFYGEHSVRIPYRNAKKYPHLVHMEDKFSFYWPYYDGSPITLWDRPADGMRDAWMIRLKKWFALKFISTSYCLHLWESLWWKKYLKDIDLEYIKNNDNNFSKLCRRYLFAEGGIPPCTCRPFRPLMKKIIDIYLPKLSNAGGIAL